MEELLEAGGADVATNQVLYNLTRRGIEYDLLDWHDQRGVPIMAYSPIEQGRLVRHAELKRIAQAHGATSAQIALAFVLDRDGVIAIPKSGSEAHVRDNAAVADIEFTDADREALDRAFPPPRRATPLEMI